MTFGPLGSHYLYDVLIQIPCYLNFLVLICLFKFFSFVPFNCLPYHQNHLQDCELCCCVAEESDWSGQLIHSFSEKSKSSCECCALCLHNSSVSSSLELLVSLWTVFVLWISLGGERNLCEVLGVSKVKPL